MAHGGGILTPLLRSPGPSPPGNSGRPPDRWGLWATSGMLLPIDDLRPLHEDRPWLMDFKSVVDSARKLKSVEPHVMMCDVRWVKKAKRGDEVLVLLFLLFLGSYTIATRCTSWTWTSISLWAFEFEKDKYLLHIILFTRHGTNLLLLLSY